LQKGFERAAFFDFLHCYLCTFSTLMTSKMRRKGAVVEEEVGTCFVWINTLRYNLTVSGLYFSIEMITGPM
jgi:hypothetical protein